MSAARPVKSWTSCAASSASGSPSPAAASYSLAPVTLPQASRAPLEVIAEVTSPVGCAVQTVSAPSACTESTPGSGSPNIRPPSRPGPSAAPAGASVITAPESAWTRTLSAAGLSGTANSEVAAHRSASRSTSNWYRSGVIRSPPVGMNVTSTRAGQTVLSSRAETTPKV